MLRSVVIALALITNSASAQVFWAGTAYGDSIEQVQAKIAYLQRLTVTPEMELQGTLAMMTSPVRLVEREFNAFFYFSNKGLDRVILRRRGQDLDLEQEHASSSALIEALRLRYGKASRRETAQAIAEGHPLWLAWESGDTDIVLFPKSAKQPLHLAYVLGERSRKREAARKAEAYRKRIDTKAEAGKL